MLDWRTLVDIAQVLSTVFLGITLLYFIKQTRATEELIKNELRPSVFLNIKSDTISGIEEYLEHFGIRFFFHNLSKFPVLVWLEVKLLIDDKDYSHSLEKNLLGKEPLFRVAPGYVRTDPYKFLADTIRQKNVKKPTTIYLQIKLLASPTFNDDLRFVCDLRSYNFNLDNHEWRDNRLGITDEQYLKSISQV